MNERTEVILEQLRLELMSQGFWFSRVDLILGLVRAVINDHDEPIVSHRRRFILVRKRPSVN